MNLRSKNAPWATVTVMLGITLNRPGFPRGSMFWEDGVHGTTEEVFTEAVLAPFAVDQAADLCSCGHEERGTPSFGQVFVTAKVESRFMIQATLG